MDTSGKYIKMCEKAEEIQGGWETQIGDYVVIRYRRVAGIIVREERDNNYEVFVSGNSCLTDTYHIEELFPLWSQERLMKIAGISIHNKVRDLLDLISFALSPYPPTYQVSPVSRNAEDIFDTFEQLLLAYAMLKRYKKVWNDEKECWEVNDERD